MQELRWLDHLPGGTLESGIELANRLYWNITWAEGEQGWVVWGGDQPILRTASREALDAFLYGLCLAYAVLPQDTFDRLVYEVKRWAAPGDITPEEHARFGGSANAPEQ